MPHMALESWHTAILQVGMRYFHKNRNKFFCPIINLDKIWSLVGEEVRRHCSCCILPGVLTYPCPPSDRPSLASNRVRADLQGRVAAAKDTSTAPVIDVTQHGYFKVRGEAATRVTWAMET